MNQPTYGGLSGDGAGYVRKEGAMTREVFTPAVRIPAYKGNPKLPI